MLPLPSFSNLGLNASSYQSWQYRQSLWIDNRSRSTLSRASVYPERDQCGRLAYWFASSSCQVNEVAAGCIIIPNVTFTASVRIPYKVNITLAELQSATSATAWGPAQNMVLGRMRDAIVARSVSP